MKDQDRMVASLADRAARLVDVALESEDPGSDQVQIPPFILKALEDSLLSGETHYTVRPGMPELRERIAHEIALAGRPQYDSINIECVLITNGNNESLFLTLLGLKLYAGEVVAAAVDQHWQHPLFEFFQLKLMEASQLLAAGGETRVIYREKESSLQVQEALVQLAEENDLPDFLNLGDAPASNHDLKIPPVSARHTLIAGTLNALPGMPIFQVGYLLGPEAYMSRIRVWKQALSICSSAPSQRAALTALTEWQERDK